MIARNTSEPRTDIESLIAEAVRSSEEIHITGRHGKAVIISERDWRSIQETLYLESISGMKDSILAGMGEPLDECEEWKPDEQVAGGSDETGEDGPEESTS